MSNTLEFATKLHMQPSSEQRYGGQPYTKHLLDVHKNAEKYIHLINVEDRVNVLDAAILHDVIEDTEMTPRKLAQKFNPTVARIVTNVSNVRSLDKIEETLLTLVNIHGHQKSTYIKICDRMANGLNSKTGADEKAKSMFKKYQKSYPTFRYALKIGNELAEMWKDLDKVFEYAVPIVADDHILEIEQSLHERLFHQDDEESLIIILEVLRKHPEFRIYIAKKHGLSENAKIGKFILEFLS